MSGGPTFVQKVANIQHMPVLIAATAASKEPPDGFLIKDIVKMTYESPQTRLFLQQYLLNNLVATNNVFIKMKVLKIFQVLLDDGHVEFKQNLRKHPEAFNEASKLRPTQPRDQKLVSECGRIRDMANRVLDQLYSDTPEFRQHGSSSSYPNQQLDTNLLGEGIGTSSGGSRIVGFGNTSVQKQATTTDKLKRMFGSTGGSGGGSSKPLVYDPGYATMDPVPHNTGSHSAFTPQISQAYHSGQFTGEEGLPTGAPRQRGRAGGGWDEGRRETLSQPLQTGYRHVHSPVNNTSQNNGGVKAGPVGVATDEEASCTEQERLLVEEITAPGGVRAAPPRDRLNAFIARCKALDCLAVVEYLREKLQSDETQVILRTLFVVEALLRSDVPDVYSHLDLTLEELNALTSSTHSSIKAKATKILMQLTAENVPRPVAVETAMDSSAQNVVLEVREDNDLVEEGVVSREQQSQEEMASLFSGMAVSGEKSPRPSRPTQPVQPVRRVKPSPPTARAKKQEQSSAFGDLLGLSSVSETPAPVEVKDDSEAAAPSLEVMAEEEDSLLMFAEDEEDFDPLRRSRGSIGQRTGSLSGKHAPPTTQGAQVPLPPPAAPTSGGGGDNLLGDLSGLDLSADTPSANPTSAPSLQDVLKPLQSSVLPTSQPLISSAPPLSSAMPLSSATPISQAQIQVVANSGGMGAVPMGVVYPGASPYGMGGVMQPHPSMYGAPGLIYMQQPNMVQLGGMARPVQRATAPSKEATPPPASEGSGFGFLGKSSKGSAFDFVQEEMKASQQ